MATNYYEILGIRKTNNKFIIKQAYKKKINNKNLTKEEKHLIQDAYDILIDDEKRNNYNEMNDNMVIIKNVYYQDDVKPQVKKYKKWQIIAFSIVAIIIIMLLLFLAIISFINLLPIILILLVGYILYQLIKGR